MKSLGTNRKLRMHENAVINRNVIHMCEKDDDSEDESTRSIQKEARHDYKLKTRYFEKACLDLAFLFGRVFREVMKDVLIKNGQTYNIISECERKNHLNCMGEAKVYDEKSEITSKSESTVTVSKRDAEIGRVLDLSFFEPKSTKNISSSERRSSLTGVDSKNTKKQNMVDSMDSISKELPLNSNHRENNNDNDLENISSNLCEKPKEVEMTGIREKSIKENVDVTTKK